MAPGRRQPGFSLTETIIAVAILAIGMIFIAGVFPVGIHFTTISTERSIAAVVADEAFSKIRLHEVDFTAWPKDANGVYETILFRPSPGTTQLPFQFVPLYEDFYAYPSRPLTTPGEKKQYYWSAVCRVVDPAERKVQVTVFISRKIGEGMLYYERLNPMQFVGGLDFPVAVWVWGVPNAQAQSKGRELIIYKGGAETHSVPLAPCVNDGSIIVDGTTGQRYRVLEKLPKVNTIDDTVIVLDRAVTGAGPRKIWVVPPPAGGGRNPCIGVFQKEIRF